MLKNIKANIIPQFSPSQIKIIRRKIDDEKEIYEITVNDFCKLVDALSKGQFTKYVNYNYDHSIDSKTSIYNMMKYILSKLSQEHIKQIFGKDCYITSIETFIFHMSKCKWYTKSFIASTIETYINTHYKLLNNRFIRINK